MGNVKRTAFQVMLILGIASGSAIADEYHYWNPVVGERSSGMAGAYTAVSDDASGLYYNPAGVVYSTGNNLSASINTFSVTNKKYLGAIGDASWNRRSTLFAPNYFGVIQHAGWGTVGFSYALPDSIQEDQDQDFPSSAAAVRRFNFKREDNTYHLGVTLAKEVSDSFSMGGSLYYHMRKNKFISNQYVQKPDGTYVWDNLYFQTEEYGLKPLLGMIYTPKGGKFSLALTATQTTLLGDASFSQETAKVDYASAASTYSYASSDNKRQYPANITLGYAWFPESSFLLAVDASYFTAVTDGIFGNRKSIINYRVGAEYYPVQTIAVRGGLFTNFANTNAADRIARQTEHVDLFGGSISIGYSHKNTLVSIGAIYQFGNGQAQIVDATSTQTLEMNSLSVFLGTSYSY